MFDLILPTEAKAPTNRNPRRLVLFAQTKVGKTEAVSKLPNSLLIDTEDGSEFVTASKINIIDLCKKNAINPLTVMQQIGAKIQEKIQKEGVYPYDYIIVDTTTGIEEFARKLATHMYKQTAIGKNFAGNDVVSDLPQGGGYDWLRKAFDELLKPVEHLAGKCFILVSHVKTSSINKQGKDLQAKDLALTGKLKQIVSGEADAIGYMYRNPQNNNETILSFKNHEQDLATGARPPHLSNQEFMILRLENPDYQENKQEKIFSNGWDKIFI